MAGEVHQHAEVVFDDPVVRLLGFKAEFDLIHATGDVALFRLIQLGRHATVEVSVEQLAATAIEPRLLLLKEHGLFALGLGVLREFSFNDRRDALEIGGAESPQVVLVLDELLDGADGDGREIAAIALFMTAAADEVRVGRTVAVGRHLDD